MDLKTYIESTNTKPVDFARALNAAHPLKVTRDMVYQWVNGIRPIPNEYGWPIELETKGMVTRQEMFPKKWRHIWPELAAASQVDSSVLLKIITVDSQADAITSCRR